MFSKSGFFLVVVVYLFLAEDHPDAGLFDHFANDQTPTLSQDLITKG